jgi:hypothetical protein
MSSWINLKAIGEILGVGLLAGAGLPVLVALGLLALSPSASGGASDAVAARPAPARIAVAALCFAVVLAAIGYGIYLIVKSGHAH